MNRGVRGSRSLRAASIAVIVAMGALAAGFTAYAAQSPVGLGSATSFAVLAGAGITNTGPTTIAGDVGTFPTTTETGFGSVTLIGTNHAGDAVTQLAKTGLTTAYGDAAGRGPTSPVVADLGGQILVPGVYNSASSLGLTGNLTLNGGGDPSAVFIFQAGSTLTTASGSSVSLINGTQSCNVYWQVGSSATLGTGSTFRGTILALSSITVTTGVTVDGRVLARNGAVTLDTDTITKPTCAALPTPTPTPTPTATPTATPTVAPTATPTVAPTATPTATPTVAPTLGVTGLPSTATLEDNSLIEILAVLVIAFAVLWLVVRARRRAPRDTPQP